MMRPRPSRLVTAAEPADVVQDRARFYAMSAPAASSRSGAISGSCRYSCASRSSRVFAQAPAGRDFVAPFEQGEIGPDLFKAACSLEGIESKRADRPYRAGRPKDWVKIKNRKHPAYRRVQDQF